MQNKPDATPPERGKNSSGFRSWIVEHPIVRRCLIGALLLALTLFAGCGQAPIVRTETVTVRVPVKPTIPAELLRECTVERSPNPDPTVGALADLAERALIELARCSAEKRAIAEALESTPVAPE